MNTLLRTTLAGVFLFLFGIPPANAQTESRAFLIWDNQTVTVGQPFQFTLEIHHPRTTVVLPPTLPHLFGQLTVLNQSAPTSTAAPDGGWVTRQIITAALYVPGKVALPPITSQTITGGSIGSIEALGLVIEVQSVLPTDPQLQPDRPPAALPSTPLWVWLSAGLVGAVVLSLSGRALWHKLPHRVTGQAPKTPQQIARAELARIAQLKLPEQGQTKEHYALLTACLLTYFGQHRNELNLDLRRASTSEILAAYPTEAAELPALHDFLQTADLVKFAKVVASPADAAQALTQAERLIN
jgi:hypothetical protein